MDEAARAVLERMPDGVAVIGPDRAIAYVNREAARLAGWPADEAAGRFWGEVFPLRDAAGFLVHEHADPYETTIAITRSSPEREYLLRTRDGDDRWVAVRASYVRDAAGAIEQAVVVLRDIGRRRRLDRARSDLISTVSHEIRSPLTSVKGFTSTLLHKWDRFNDEQKQNMLQMMNADADRVTRLLTELLDVSRLEAGRLELRRQEVDVAVIAGQVCDRLRRVADRHTIECAVPDDLPKIVADPGKLEQVLVNLVENALKYSDPGTVTVAAGVEGDELVVTVTDEGPGIDQAHVPHLFTKFYRRGQGERRTGTGLGLYICKGLIQAHGGRLFVKETTPAGSVFAFALPLDAEVAPQ